MQYPKGRPGPKAQVGAGRRALEHGPVSPRLEGYDDESLMCREAGAGGKRARAGLQRQFVGRDVTLVTSGADGHKGFQVAPAAGRRA